MLAAEEALGFGVGDELETNAIAGAELANAGNVGSDDVGDFGVATGGLLVDEEEDGLAIGGELDGAEGDALGDHLAGIGGEDGRAVEAEAHAIGVGRDEVFGVVKGIGGEGGRLGAGGDAESGVVGCEGVGDWVGFGCTGGRADGEDVAFAEGASAEAAEDMGGGAAGDEFGVG